MRTNVTIGGKKDAAAVSRTSPVRLLPAIALEPFSSDMEMLTNKYQADKKQLQSSIANFENQRTLFRYSICIDLHRIGSEQDEIGTRFSLNSEKYNSDPSFQQATKKFLDNLRKQNIKYEEKSKRVSQLLEIVGRLYRDIRGRREDLKPLFIVGGVYDTFNPFFENIINIELEKGKKPKVNRNSLEQMLEASYTTFGPDGKEDIKSVKQDTFIGIREGFFANEISEFKSLYPNVNESKEHVGSPEHVISKLKEKVREYYKQEEEEEE